MRALPAWLPLCLLAVSCAPAARPPETGTATAGAPTTAPSTAPATMRVSTPGGTLNIRVRPDEMRSTFIIAAAPDRVWRTLPAVFDSLGMPAAGVLDAAARRFGTTGLRVRRRLGSTPVSRYFDCGQTQIGENADEYDVQLQLVVALTAGTAGTTNLDVLLDARARPVAFSQGYQACSTRGTLDKRLVELVRVELARP